MNSYYRATSVADACDRLAGDDGAELIAGGQTLTLLLRQGLKSPDRLVDISRIDELTRVVDRGDAVGIGSAVTYEALRDSELVQEEFPHLAAAIDHIAGPQVRANGTIGGGLCHGDPALDAPPVLLTLDAELALRSQSGQRVVPLADFYVGYYETVLEPDELLAEVTVPKLPPNSFGSYRTLAPRQGDYAIAGVAVRATFEGRTCATARVALTNGGDTPKRAAAAEAAVDGSAIDDATVEAAVDALDGDLDLVGDAQVSEWYQATVFRRLAEQALRDVEADREAATAGGTRDGDGSDEFDGSDRAERDR